MDAIALHVVSDYWGSYGNNETVLDAQLMIHFRSDQVTI